MMPGPVPWPNGVSFLSMLPLSCWNVLLVPDPVTSLSSRAVPRPGLHHRLRRCGRRIGAPFVATAFLIIAFSFPGSNLMASLPVISGSSPAARVQLDRLGRKYTPAVGPRLKVVLAILFASVALLGATGSYLLAIRLLEWWRAQTYTNQFTLSMLLAHIAVGIIALAPFLFFGIYHFATARQRPNKVAVRLGIFLFIFGLIACGTGLALVQIFERWQLPTGTLRRLIVYWLHLFDSGHRPGPIRAPSPGWSRFAVALGRRLGRRRRRLCHRHGAAPQP